MGVNIIKVVDKSKKVDPKIVSVPRMLILFSLEELVEGSTYRELKSGLEMDEGTIFANLRSLEEMKYIEKEEKAKIEKKKLNVFKITEKGKKEVKNLRSWLKEIIKGGSNE